MADAGASTERERETATTVFRMPRVPGHRFFYIGPTIHTPVIWQYAEDQHCFCIWGCKPGV